MNPPRNNRLKVLAAVTAILAVIGTIEGVRAYLDAHRPVTLNVQIADLPADASGQVHVSGQGITRQIGHSQSLTGLAAGHYEVLAKPVPIGQDKYYASVASTGLDLRPGSSATVTVDYAEIVPPTTQVVDSTTGISVFAPNSLTFADGNNPPAIGTVIASSSIPAAPHGFLRRVVSLSGQTATTVDAALTEALIRGKFSIDESLRSPEPITTSLAIDGRSVPIELVATSSPAPASSSGLQSVNFVKSCGGSGASFNPSASISITPHVVFDWSWGWLPPSLNSMHFEAGVAESAGVALAADAKLTCSGSGSLKFAFRDLHFQVGPVPVIITPELSFAGTAAATFSSQGSAGLSQTARVTVGFRYRNGSFEPIFAAPSVFTPAHTANVALIGDVWAKPKFELKLYGAGGPYFDLKADANIASTFYGGKIVASLEAHAGIDFNIPVLGNFDKSLTLTVDSREFSWGTNPPVGDSCLPGTWTMSLEDNPSGWKFNGQVVPVKGVAGQVVIITPEGTDTVNWANSQPLLGTYQGKTLAISLRGNAAATVHGADGLYSVTNVTGALTAVFIWGGKSYPGSAAIIGTQGLPYSCSATQLVIHYPGSITDTYTRTG